MSQRKIKKLKKQVEFKATIIAEVIGKDVGIWETIKNNWKFLAGLCGGVFLLYFNSLTGAFVSDDYATIPQNPLIGDFLFATKGSLVSISNFFIYKLFGFGSPIPYHFYSLILYLGVIVLMFVFVLLVTNNLLLAQITLILFAVNPLHVEAVSWISGKPYLISPITVIISLIFLIRFLRSRNKRLILPLILSILICFYSEKIRFFSFVFIGLIFAFTFDWYGKSKINWVKIGLFGLIIGGVVVALIYPAVMVRINAVNSGTNASGSLFYDPFFQYPTSMAKYLQLIWAPIDLTLYHTMYVFPVWLNWAILLTCLSMVVYFFFKNKLYFFALMFIFAGAAPSMAPVKVSWLVAERYMFLGSLGFALFLGLIVVSLMKYFKLLPEVLFILLMVLFGVRTFVRNIDWQSNHNLWVNTCQVSPNSHNAWNNIGDDYDKLKQYENAIKGFTQSTIVKPNYADAYHNRANIFYKVGRLDLARESYLTAIKFNPGLYQTYMSLTQVDLTNKRGDLALQDAILATQVAPNDPQSWYVLGVVQSQIGETEEAQKTMKKLLEAFPGYNPAADALVQLRSKT